MVLNHRLFVVKINVFGSSISCSHCLSIICCDYATEHEIVSYYSKTVSIVLNLKIFKNLQLQLFLWLVQLLSFNCYRYL